MDANHNIVLIGMPGAGKSTIGVLLAKATSRDFIDTDVFIQHNQGKQLQEIIDTKGPAEFCKIEESVILSLNCESCVIATGGSVVYSERAMAHLKSSGVIVFLDLPLEFLEKRLNNMDSRGVVRFADEPLADLYKKRLPLYKRYADIAVDCAGLNHEQAVLKIISVLNS